MIVLARKKLFHDKITITNIASVPDDQKNFEYPDPDNQGKTILIKFPRDYKTGINPETGKPYQLSTYLNMYTTHLSKYCLNYVFF